MQDYQIYLQFTLLECRMSSKTVSRKSKREKKTILRKTIQQNQQFVLKIFFIVLKHPRSHFK